MECVDLRGLAKAKGFRTGWDPAYFAEAPRVRKEESPWLVRIPCKSGAFIGVQGEGALHAYIPKGWKAATRILALEGSILLTKGDREWMVGFPAEQLEAVAEILGARRRMRLTEEERKRRADVMRKLREKRRRGWVA